MKEISLPKFHWIVFFVLIVFLSMATNAFAASSGTRNQSAAGGALFVAFAIAYFSRRRAIGGWLLYYYVQLYAGFAFSLLFIPQIIKNLSPSNWQNSLEYVMYFFSVMPVFAVEIVELYAGTKLLFRKNKANVTLLRNVLIALVVVSGCAIAIDLIYFKEDGSFIFDIFIFVFSIIWAWYFSKARRVKLVFIENNWTYTPYSERRQLSTADKRKLAKRALIAASVTFVLFLLMMGTVLKDEGKPPDAGIFVVPIFYAIIAALLGWFLPLRKKKINSTVASQTNTISNQNDT
jgi:hypothetical protein